VKIKLPLCLDLNTEKNGNKVILDGLGKSAWFPVNRLLDGLYNLESHLESMPSHFTEQCVKVSV
jgi:hypothetical protein